MTVSAWWVFWGFLGGGCLGVVLMSLMFVASAEQDQVETFVGGHTDPPDDAHVLV